MHTSVPQKTNKNKRNQNICGNAQANPDNRENDECKDRNTITSDGIFVPNCMVQAFINRGILPKRAAEVLAKQCKQKLDDSSPCSAESKLSRILDEGYEKQMEINGDIFVNSDDADVNSLSLTEDMIIKLGIQHQCFPSITSLNWKSLYSSATCENAEKGKLVSSQMEALNKVKIVGMLRHKTVHNFEDIFESGRFSSSVSIAAHMTRTENKKFCKSSTWYI